MTFNGSREERETYPGVESLRKASVGT